MKLKPKKRLKKKKENEKEAIAKDLQVVILLIPIKPKTYKNNEYKKEEQRMLNKNYSLREDIRI